MRIGEMQLGKMRRHPLNSLPNLGTNCKYNKNKWHNFWYLRSCTFHLDADLNKICPNKGYDDKQNIHVHEEML